MASTDAAQRAANLSQPGAIAPPESAARGEAIIASDIDLLVTTGERDSLGLAEQLLREPGSVQLPPTQLSLHQLAPTFADAATRPTPSPARAKDHWPAEP